MARIAFGGGTGRKMRGEVALGLMLVATGVVGVTMIRGTSDTPSVEVTAESVTVPTLSAGDAYVSVAVAPGSHPPHLAPGDVVWMFGSAMSDDLGATTVVTSQPATVHAVTVDPTGSDSIVTLVGDPALGGFLVSTDKVRLVIVGSAR
jgi:hypothetical protein